MSGTRPRTLNDAVIADLEAENQRLHDALERITDSSDGESAITLKSIARAALAGTQSENLSVHMGARRANRRAAEILSADLAATPSEDT
jgi:hypothetical protein